MSTATTFSTADPLTRQPLGERPVYATGMLLDAQDFLDEQTYHRSQLARALGAVAGSGTLAGLRVEHRPAVDTGPDAAPEDPGTSFSAPPFPTAAPPSPGAPASATGGAPRKRRHAHSA